MKEWNAPSMEELNVTETANGFFDSDFETLILLNDSKKSTTPDNNDEKPENQMS